MDGDAPRGGIFARRAVAAEEQYEVPVPPPVGVAGTAGAVGAAMGGGRDGLYAALDQAISLVRGARCSARARAMWSGGALPASRVDGLGGDGSVRGYDHAELGTDARAVAGTLEVRLPLQPAENSPAGMGTALALFADAGGSIRDKPPPPRDPWDADADAAPPPPEPYDLVAGASGGCGVRFGPIRFDVAWNLRGERKVHVGLDLDAE